MVFGRKYKELTILQTWWWRRKAFTLRDHCDSIARSTLTSPSAVVTHVDPEADGLWHWRVILEYTSSNKTFCSLVMAGVSTTEAEAIAKSKLVGEILTRPREGLRSAYCPLPADSE